MGLGDDKELPKGIKKTVCPFCQQEMIIAKGFVISKCSKGGEEHLFIATYPEPRKLRACDLIVDNIVWLKPWAFKFF